MLNWLIQTFSQNVLKVSHFKVSWFMKFLDNLQNRSLSQICFYDSIAYIFYYSRTFTPNFLHLYASPFCSFCTFYTLSGAFTFRFNNLLLYILSYHFRLDRSSFVISAVHCKYSTVIITATIRNLTNLKYFHAILYFVFSSC